MAQEVKKFDTEVGKILHLMIHSLYTNKEIFLRELISNSSDACDKLRYLSISDSDILQGDPEFKILIKIDKEKRSLVIRDNGIGMNRADLVNHLGTIAKSGTSDFLESLALESKKNNLLIGQFGVGFYSAFMVAERVFVKSKKAGDLETYTWESNGLGEYIVGEFDGEFSRGTEVTIYFKSSEQEYLDHFRLKHIVKSYSDHISIPIYYLDAETGNENQLNSGSALWTRSKLDITDEQYKEFYKSVSYSADEPWITLHNKNEGIVEFTNLLFIPASKTFDLFHPDRKRRVKLYIKRVFISDENIDIIPSYLRFLRGVVDSEDLPLNISRESLQHNSVLEKIKSSITTKVLLELKKKKDGCISEYIEFWGNFGAALKEGLCEATSDHEKLLDVCIFKSSLTGKMIGLDEYVKNFQGTQNTIYYLSGDDPTKLLSSPQIEGFLKRKIDVLLFTDTVDDFWVNVNHKYKDYSIKSVTRCDIDLAEFNSSDDEKKDEIVNDEDFTKLTNYFKEVLVDRIQFVQVSKKLTSSPACLVVGDGAMDIRMERFLIEQKQLISGTAKILELNPRHIIIKKISSDINSNSQNDFTKELVKLIFDQACIIEGETIDDTGGFVRRLNAIIENAIIKSGD